MKLTIISRTGTEATLTGLTDTTATIVGQDGKEKTVKHITLTSGYQMAYNGNTATINKTLINELLAEDKKEQQEQTAENQQEEELITVHELAKETGYSEKVLRRKLRKMDLKKKDRVWKWNPEDKELEQIRKLLRKSA